MCRIDPVNDTIYMFINCFIFIQTRVIVPGYTKVIKRKQTAAGTASALYIFFMFFHFSSFLFYKRKSDHPTHGGPIPFLLEYSDAFRYSPLPFSAGSSVRSATTCGFFDIWE